MELALGRLREILSSFFLISMHVQIIFDPDFESKFISLYRMTFDYFACLTWVCATSDPPLCADSNLKSIENHESFATIKNQSLRIGVIFKHLSKDLADKITKINGKLSLNSAIYKHACNSDICHACGNGLSFSEIEIGLKLKSAQIFKKTNSTLHILHDILPKTIIQDIYFSDVHFFNAISSYVLAYLDGPSDFSRLNKQNGNRHFKNFRRKLTTIAVDIAMIYAKT